MSLKNTEGHECSHLAKRKWLTNNLTRLNKLDLINKNEKAIPTLISSSYTKDQVRKLVYEISTNVQKNCWRFTQSTKKITSIVNNSNVDNDDKDKDKNGSTETEKNRGQKANLVLGQVVNEKNNDDAMTEDPMAMNESDQNTDDDKKATGNDDKEAMGDDSKKLKEDNKKR